MLVSLNWLKNYVDISSNTPEDLAEKISKAGIEVDGIAYIAAESSGVVVGHVESCEQHPNADKLNLCQVDVGNEQLQIICGAPNVRQGQKVAVAKPGAVLPNNFKIKKVKLRGVESNGMICSLQELGIDEKYVPKDIAEGIFVFPDDVTVGESVEPLLNLNDAVLEFDLTPNRADALSMLGVAYETAAILDQEVHLPSETVHPGGGKTGDYVSVKVEAPELNPYYGAFIARDVEIKPSPMWMRNALMAAGIRPINNVVDITNYVLLEYGQPLHAFDYDRFGSDQVVTRRAEQNEKMTTLDGEQRTLSNENLVITNGKEPVALAGVMGGLHTEVNENTTTVLLEAAYFAPFAVRTTVKDTGLRSDSSTRFEKSVDPNRVERAGLRACHLLEKYAGATILADPVSFDELDRSETTVVIETDEINNRLGTAITTEDIGLILNRLQFLFEQDNDRFVVKVPTRRGDITIFEDMLEEVARIYGYDHLPYTLPKGSSQAGGLTKKQQLKREVKNYLQSTGLMETITYSLTDDAVINKLISPELRKKSPNPVQLSMPMSEDHQYLRLSILPELLKTLAYNRARKQTNIQYFELGNVFVTDETTLSTQPDEQLRLAGALTGLWVHHPWQQEKKQVDFYLIKGIIEGLFDLLNIPISFEQTKLPDMHPGRCATVSSGNRVIGFLGQVHPSLEKTMDINETYVFDIDMEAVLHGYTNTTGYKPIPKYPSVARDIAFIVDEEVNAGDLQETITAAGSPLVQDVQIFDVYKGENLPDGKKSIAYSLLYQDPEKTLKDDEVEQSYQKIVDTVNKKFNAYVRS
ncbi:phenylalanyl-tRNA synthetase beta subunit [Lentibacillus halodurans]|uniref:Phenylalanine--tRNA ligase beta subunit n=1 Tax=Lentibacillus halodurans TaxID=237679 RepID=A0A1I0ZFH9_9BACI|nr:phenylalanine--tRNA ligase subunit beta [Lentibacillus halodurans]SFB24424.1 phenylalanyl-tRNA synthetase beta subunit [Lentibacillus halodurans]